MGKTTIGWTATRLANGTKVEGYTFNPWSGCTKVDPACDLCYAFGFDLRFFGGEHWGPRAPRKTRAGAYWNAPLEYDKLAGELGVHLKVFCASHADVFDNCAPQELRARLFDTIKATPNLDWKLCTKRIGNAIKPGMLPPDWDEGYENVVLMVTMARQETVDRDTRKFLAVPANRRAISAEPLLEAVVLPDDLLAGIDLLITGGESKPDGIKWKHLPRPPKPCHPEWVRALKAQAAAAGVPFHHKQWGYWRPVERAEDLDAHFSGRRVVMDIYGSITALDSLEAARRALTNGGHLQPVVFEGVGARRSGNLLDGAECDAEVRGRETRRKLPGLGAKAAALLIGAICSAPVHAADSWHSVSAIPLGGAGKPSAVRSPHPVTSRPALALSAPLHAPPLPASWPSATSEFLELNVAVPGRVGRHYFKAGARAFGQFRFFALGRYAASVCLHIVAFGGGPGNEAVDGGGQPGGGLEQADLLTIAPSCVDVRVQYGALPVRPRGVASPALSLPAGARFSIRDLTSGHPNGYRQTDRGVTAW